MFHNYCVTLLVRHGQTDWNLAGKKQGHAKTRLNETGKRQAKEMAERLKREKIDAIYSSDLPRAMETAREINKFHNLRIHKTKLLREIDIGECNGLTSVEMREKFPEWGKLKDAEPEKTPYPEGESHLDVQARARRFIKMLNAKKCRIVLVVGHNGMNRNLAQVLTETTYEKQRMMDFDHGMIYMFDPERGKFELCK